MDKFTINVKNGFYVGDLCYALSREVYDGVWGKNNYELGKYEYEGKEFAMVNTAFGDGCYMGSDGFDYPVDAGIIGVCDIDLAVGEYKHLGQIYYYTGEVTIVYDNGTIYVQFGDDTIVIPTDSDDFGYEDEDWPDYSDEEEDEEDRW